MITIQEIRKPFFDRVNEKMSPELLLPNFPSFLLDNAIVECIEGYKINDKTLYEHLGPNKFLDFVYDKWKFRYNMYLKVDTDRTSMTIEGVDAVDIQNRQGQFEGIFEKIDALAIFGKAEL